MARLQREIATLGRSLCSYGSRRHQDRPPLAMCVVSMRIRQVLKPPSPPAPAFHPHALPVIAQVTASGCDVLRLVLRSTVVVIRGGSSRSQPRKGSARVCTRGSRLKVTSLQGTSGHLGGHTGRGGRLPQASWWVETRDAAQHPTAPGPRRPPAPQPRIIQPQMLTALVSGSLLFVHYFLGLPWGKEGF